MRTAIHSTIAIFVTLFAGVHPAGAAEARASISPPSARAIKAVQDAVTAKQYPEAVRKAAEALAIPTKTPFDAFITYGFLAYSHQAMGNRAEVLNAMQGQLDSGYPGPAEQKRLSKDMMGIAFQLKDYPRVVEFGQRIIRAGNAEADTYELVAQAMSQQGNIAEASGFLGRHVADLGQKGQKPGERTLVALRSLQERAGDSKGAADTLEALVINYPRPDYWNLVTYKLIRGSNLNDRQKLQVFRLKLATGTLKRCQDYTEMADIAVASGMAMEGLRALEQALANKACPVKADEDRVRRKIGSIGRVAAEDERNYAEKGATASTAASGEADVARGAFLFAKGDYPAAAAAISAGVSKGDLKDLSDAQLTLATAQYRSGKKDESLKTLRGINAVDQMTQRIVDLWILYVR